MLKTIITENKQFGLRPTDILISSFPRSGNRWLRVLIADILLQLNGIVAKININDPISSISLNMITPNMHQSDLSIMGIDPRIKIPYRIIKTHHISAHHKTIYVFRNPADSLRSYYYFRLKHNAIGKDIDTFAIENVDDWVFHVFAHIKNKQNTQQETLFVSYEWLTYNPTEAFSKVLKFLELNPTADQIQSAIDNQSFDKIISIILIKGDNQGIFEQSQGRVGTGLETFQEPTLEHIKRKTKQTYDIAELLQWNELWEEVEKKHQQGDLFGTEKALQQLHQKTSQNCDILVSLGTLYFEMKQFDKSREFLKKAVEINPYDEGALQALSRIDQSALDH